MSWLRIDDGFVEHEKVIGLSDRAFRLHMGALCFCARNLTDGRLNSASIRMVSGLVSATKKHVSELETAGLWLPNADGFEVKDYLEYNMDAETAKALKKRRSDAGKLGAAKRWDDGKSHDTGHGPGYSKSHGKHDANGNGKTDGPLGNAPSHPIRIDQNPVTETVLQDAELDSLAAEQQDQPGNGSGAWSTCEDLKPLSVGADEDIPF